VLNVGLANPAAATVAGTVATALPEYELTVSMDVPLASGTRLVRAPQWAFLNASAPHAIPPDGAAADPGTPRSAHHAPPPMRTRRHTR
jgi:hypothetical protein